MDILKKIKITAKESINPYLSKESLIFLGIIFALLFFAYSPLIHFNYIFHDDFYFFSSWTKESCDGYGQFWAYKYNYGRPIGGAIKCFYGMSFDDISGAKYIRAFNIVLLSIYIFLIFNYIFKLSGSKWFSILLSASIAFLTSYQTPIAQISNAHHIFAAIFALLGLLVSISYNNKLNYFSPANIAVSIVAYILLVVSVLTYQPSAMLFWSFLTIYIFFKINDMSLEKIRNIFYISLPCFVAMLTSFLYLKAYSNSRGGLVTDLSEKIIWLQKVFPILFSYFDVLPNNFLLYLTLLIFISAASICLIKTIALKDSKELFSAFVKFSSYLGLFVLSIFPLLAAKESVVNHRTLIAPKTLIVIFFFYALYYVINFCLKKESFKQLYFIIASIVFVTFGAIKTQSNMIHYYAIPSSLEYSFLSRKISSIDFTKEQHYHIIKPKLPYLSKVSFADEFGNPSTIFRDDIFNIIVLIARENNMEVDPKDILSGKYFSSGDGKVIERPIEFEGHKVQKDSVFINMNDIRGITFRKESK